MIKRGMAIYEPRGKAGEYAPLAINLYIGCGHKCIYCYAPDLARKPLEEFHKPSPRPHIIERLEWELPIAKVTYTGKDKRVLLCFTCDPYQPIDVEYQLTRKTIILLHAYDFNVNILTKCGKRAERDFDLLRAGDQFAVTLTLLNDKESRIWEPAAPLPQERIETLKKAHDLGIKTWVSLEPVIDPAQSLEIIRQTHTFVDLYKVGKMNYHSIEKQINWRRFLYDAVNLLKELKCDYYIKEDLRRYGHQG